MNFGWGGNPYGAGFGNNPDQGRINNYMNMCVQTGSYTFGGNATQAAMAVYNSLKSKSSSLSIEKGDYAENPSITYEVLYFSGPIEVFYSGAKYSIYIKVLLPPNFPEAAPIISVINIDTNVFMVNKEYAKGLLPDETYAIELFNASQWSYHKNFDAIFFELTSKLGSTFPFFKSSNPVRPNPPRFYPPLVSANQMGQQSNWGGNQGGWNQGGGNYNQQFPGGNPQYSNFGGPGQYNSNYNSNPSMSRPGGDSQSGPSPQTTSFLNEQVNSLVLAMKSDIQGDKKTLGQLAKLRTENQMLCDQYKNYHDSLLKLNEKNSKNLTKLNSHKESIQAMNIENMIDNQSIFKPEDRSSLELIDNLANLRAIEEADKEMQDLFKNGDLNIPFEEVYNMVEKLAKQEFTIKSKIIQLTKA